VLGKTGAVFDLTARCSGETDIDAEPGRDDDSCAISVEVAVEAEDVVAAFESSNGRNAGVKTPAKLSWASGVGGVIGPFSGNGNARKSVVALFTPGVGGRCEVILNDRAEGERGDGGEPTTKLDAGRVCPLMLVVSSPVVGLLRGAVSRELSSLSP
jgi:hypothetical protein